MIIGLLQIEVVLTSRSLKEKRFVIKSFKDRVINKFNVAIAETGYTDKRQRSELSMVTVSSDKKVVENILRKILGFADENPGWIVNRYHLDLY